MNKFFRNIVSYHGYAVRSAKSELKSEVADSYLNWLWWIIEPLCFMLIYTFIFTVIFKNDTPFFPVFVFVGLTVWTFFNRMVNGSVKLIISNRDLVTKVYLPKYILLLAKSYTYVFKTAISFVITFILMIFQHVKFSWHIIQIIPVFLILYLFVFGVGMILMHFGVTVNDLSNLMNILLRMVFYLSGVFYNINTRLVGRVGFIMLHFNPAAFFMDQMRIALLQNSLLNYRVLGIWFAISVVLCFIGMNLIHKNENSYAKII